MSRNVHAGGASTIDGVRYQMLWSLLRTTELHILHCTLDKSTKAIAPILRFEPVGGGGDLQEISPSKVIVEQIKSRSTGKPWSLREVIDGVLSDLYKAVDKDCPSIAYRFVTEGERGNWENVYEFFQSLRSLPCPATDVLASLDDQTHLPFGKGDESSKTSNNKDVYWRLPEYTQRSLFVHIVDILRAHKPAKNEAPDTTHRNLWHLLSNFNMRPLRLMASIQSAIDASLLAMGCPNTELDRTRRAMVPMCHNRVRQNPVHEIV